MNKEQKAKWVKALSSGRFSQVNGELRARNDDYTYSYCCLGVANYTCRLGVDYEEGYLRDEESSKPNFLPMSIQRRLANLNDRGVPFEMIAGFIDAYVEPDE